MKVIIKLLLLIFIFSFNQLKSQTNVSGLVSVNTTWALAKSPYIVTGNVLVPNGVTLTIEPGVEVRFGSGLLLQVSGSLIADGTASKHITFTANTSNPTKGYWNCISITGPYTGGPPNNAPVTSFLSYCDVKFGGSGSNGLVRVENKTARITNCSFTESSSKGLTFSNSPTAVEGCTIINNNGNGIHHERNPGLATTIADNRISNNRGIGIYVLNIYSHDFYVRNNKIRQNAGAIRFDDEGGSGGSKVYLENNLIDSNESSSTPAAIFVAGGLSLEMTGNTVINNKSTDTYIIDVRYGYNPYTHIIRNNYIGYNKAINRDLIYFYFPFVSYINEVFELSDNIIINNAATGGAILRMLGNNGYAGFNMKVLKNTITGNSGNYCFNLSTFGGFINNNTVFNGNKVLYEIFNQNQLNEPEIDAKNNFWNRTREQLDMYIYDFLDEGNRSFVVLDPIKQCTNVWTGNVSSTWSDPRNWSCNLVPDENTDVVIDSGNIVVTENAKCRSLTLKTGVVFEVKPFVAFTVTH